MNTLGYSYHAVAVERSKDDVIDIFEFPNFQARAQFLGGNADTGTRIASIHPATDAIAQRIYDNCSNIDGDWGRLTKIQDILL